jgi:hypothetical protein
MLVRRTPFSANSRRAALRIRARAVRSPFSGLIFVVVGPTFLVRAGAVALWDRYQCIENNIFVLDVVAERPADRS